MSKIQYPYCIIDIHAGIIYYNDVTIGKRKKSSTDVEILYYIVITTYTIAFVCRVRTQFTKRLSND